MSRRKDREPGFRTAHGRSAECGRLTASECTPADELSDGVPGPARAESPTDRGVGGHFAHGNSLAARGGKARAGSTRLGSSLGVADASDEEVREGHARAESFRRAQCATVAATVGGGICGPGPSSMIASAALALAGSRLLYSRANGDPKVLATAAKLADSSRASLRDAHQLAALEAKARAGQVDPYAALEADFQAWQAKQPQEGQGS